MGSDIEREQFEAQDREAFTAKLEEGVAALRQLLARPGFGEGEPSLGAELELDLVDAAGRPANLNEVVRREAGDDRITLELDRFNLELNARPDALAGRPFSGLAEQLEAGLSNLRSAAQRHAAEVVAVGILPTLLEGDLDLSALSDGRRYRALAREVERARAVPSGLCIVGAERLEVAGHNISFEGATTSFQVHLRPALQAFIPTYNAAQLATGFVTAVSGNSPFFLERSLWQETRIALFRQAADDRGHPQADDLRPARVSFGHGWARSSVAEFFAESAALHEPLLPDACNEDPLAEVAGGGVPRLTALRLHHGTVWRWNRAIYDPAGDGHVRIELRALPSGPTVVDMVANAALVIGLTLALAPEADALVSRITFGHARHNFYEAASKGFDAQLLWPTRRGTSPRARSVRELADELLPLAEVGLVQGGVEQDEAARWLSIVRARIAAGTTGSLWQTRTVATLEASMPRREALARMFATYREHSAGGEPVHTWPEV